MSAAVVQTGAVRDNIGSVSSTKSINYNVFTPRAASALPRDDEVTMSMYNGDDGMKNITIVPKVAKTEPNVKATPSKAGSFVMNTAQVKPTNKVEGNIKPVAKSETNSVRTSIVTNNEPQSYSIKRNTVETSVKPQTSEAVKRTESSSSRRTGNTAVTVKKVGSFQMKSAHSGVELPLNTTKAKDNSEFTANLQRTLERKGASAAAPVDTSKVALRGNVNSNSVAPNMSSSSHSAINKTDNSVNGPSGAERHTSQSDNSHLVTHDRRIASGGGEISSTNIQRSSGFESLEKRQSGVVGLDSVGTGTLQDKRISSEEIKPTLSNQAHNRYTSSNVTTNITEPVKAINSGIDYKSKAVNSPTRNFNTEYSDITVKSEAVIKPSHITEATQAQRTQSEIKYSVVNNKQNLNRGDNIRSVNAGARSSYAVDDVKVRSSEQVGEIRSHGDVPGKTISQSGKYNANNSEIKSENSKQEGNRYSNISEWSNHSETGKKSRPDSLLLNSEDYKAKIGNQLAANLHTNAERIEERKSVFSPGRVQAQTVQFENRDQVTSPISPAALEAQEAVKSGLVGQISVGLKHLPLTGRSLDAATLEKKKQGASKNSTETQAPQKKQPKFLVEGIDYPAPDKAEQTAHPDAVKSGDLTALQSKHSLVSTDTDTESTTLQRTEKKGFAYLKDKAITSEVLKKAETVTAKRPHEKVEVRSLDNQLRAKSPEESQHLIEARSSLHHIQTKRQSIPGPASENNPNPLQFALKKNLLGEIHKTVDKKEASNSGQAQNTVTKQADIVNTETGVEAANNKQGDNTDIDPVYQRHLPRREDNSKRESQQDIVPSEQEPKHIDKTVTRIVKQTNTNITSADGITSFIDNPDENLVKEKEKLSTFAVVRVNSKGAEDSQEKVNEFWQTNDSKITNLENKEDKFEKSYVAKVHNNPEKSSNLEDGIAKVYVNSTSEKFDNQSVKERKETIPDSAYVSNPVSPVFEFDLQAANLPDEPEMVVQNSTVQHGTAPPGMYKAERRVKSSYSTKTSGQPEKKMESETKESYEWRGADGRNVAVATARGGAPRQAIQSGSNQRQALLHEGRAPNMIPLQAVEVDIENKNTHPDAGVTSPTVRHMQSLFETQNIASNYSQNQDFMSGPNATSSIQRTEQRRTGDVDVNFQKVPTIRSGYERKAFEDVQTNQTRPSEPVGTFQNLQSLRTNYEYQSSNQHSNRPSEAMPTQNMKMSSVEVNTGQRDPRQRKRRKKHVTNVSVEGYQSEGGYASSSDAGSMINTRHAVSPYPGMHRSTTPTVAGQTVVSGGSMNRTTQDINTNVANAERVITPHLREAMEENGQYHIKLDLNTNMQQALRSAVAQTSESMTREEMMRNEQYKTTTGTNQYATTGSTGIAGQTIEGHTNNTLASGYNTYGGSRGPTPTAGMNGKTDFLMNVNQTMTLDYVPRGNTPVPQGKSISNIHLENEHRRTLETDDHFAVKSLTRTQHIPREPEDEGRYVETLQIHENRKTPQINVERGNYLIKNSIDTTSAPKVVDVVEDNYSEGDVNIEDNTNMFDGLYYQSKLNPMYSSDQDLRNQDLYRDEVDNRRTTTVRTVKTVQDVPTEEVVDYNSNIKYRAPRGHDTTSSWTYHQQRHPSESSSMESVEYEQQQRNANYGRQYSREERMDTLDNDDSMYEEGFNEQWEETKKWKVPTANKSSASSRRMKKTSVSEYDFNRLLRDAPADSVKQSINVEREEEEIIGPLPLSHADGSSSNAEGMLNFDAISEKVDLGMKDGAAQLAVKVRCERVVPVYGQEEVYKKSSVIVTRLIEIDMEVNEERLRLYENIMRGGAQQGMIEYGPGGSKFVSGRSRKLTSKETFNLYKTFMGMAEEQEGMQQQQMHIERKVEDGAPRPDMAMDSDMDFRRLAARKVKSPESDTISYMSATEQPDILY